MQTQPTHLPASERAFNLLPDLSLVGIELPFRVVLRVWNRSYEPWRQGIGRITKKIGVSIAKTAIPELLMKLTVVPNESIVIGTRPLSHNISKFHIVIADTLDVYSVIFLSADIGQLFLGKGFDTNQTSVNATNDVGNTVPFIKKSFLYYFLAVLISREQNYL